MWMAKGKILIAVPTFENIKPQCFKSIYGLTNPKDFNLYFDYVKGYDCAHARNEIAKLAIKHDFDPDINVMKKSAQFMKDFLNQVTISALVNLLLQNVNEILNILSNIQLPM